MSDVSFYHLTQSSDEAALPLLLEKVLERKATAFVQVNKRERAVEIDKHLWVYNETSFMPHAMQGEEMASHAPIIIGEGEVEMKDMLFLLNQSPLPQNINDYKRIFILFSGLNNEDLEFARKQWKEVKAINIPASYFQQTTSGGWEKKA